VKKDKIVLDILANPSVFSIFEHLKTEKWKKLSEDRKRNYFKKMNKYVCQAINIDPIEIVFDESGINKDSFFDEDEYKNVVVDDEDRLVINDINYNQYLTLYEYFFRLRMYILESDYLEEYDAKLPKDKKEKLNKNYRNVEYGDILIRMDIDEGEPYEDYQFINKESKEFSETILFEIIKRNYDKNNGHDEEFFMSDYNIYENSFVSNAAEKYLNDHIVERSYYINIMNKVIEKKENLKRKDISDIEDKDLFFIIYPSVIKNSDSKIIIKGFNEILSRIYSSDIKINYNNQGIIINKNIYPKKQIDNLFNIVIYECLNDIDVSLRNNPSLLDKEEINDKDLNKAIFAYKKKWLFSVINRIDTNIDLEDFVVFKYQSLYRLLDKEKIQSILMATSGNDFPFRKRRVKQ